MVSWIDVIELTMDRAVVSRKAKLCDLVNEFFFFCGKCHTLFHCTCLQIPGIEKRRILLEKRVTSIFLSVSELSDINGLHL